MKKETEAQKLERLRNEYDVINKQAINAKKQRTEWINKHLEDFAQFKIGELVYDISTDMKIGTVTRYLASDYLRNNTDASMSVTYEVSYYRDSFGIKYYSLGQVLEKGLNRNSVRKITRDIEGFSLRSHRQHLETKVAMGRACQQELDKLNQKEQEESKT